MKKVLIITYYWPPSGGPGVQRVLKFAKYLPQFGWQPIILTVKDGEYPAIDETLAKDIPPECIVYKTNSWEPTNLYKKFAGMKKDEKIPVAVLSEKNISWKKKIANWIRLNLFIPDAKIGWIPFAVRKGKKIIKDHQPDVIFSSSPPPTVHLIAKKLAKWSSLKWVADFRDPWTQIHYYKNNRLNLFKTIDTIKEKKVVNSADWLTTASKQFVELIGAKKKQNTTVITNGFDDIQPKFDKINNKKLSLVYVGGLNKNRYYKQFFTALCQLIEQGILSRKNFTLKFFGKVENSIQREIEKLLKHYSVLDFNGYVPHQEAIREMYKGDVLLLLFENVNHYGGHIPGKLFEYMVTGNYILGIGDKKGNAAEILSDIESGEIVSGDADFVDVIINLYNKWRNNKLKHDNLEKILKYSRKELTENLVNVFNGLL